MPKVRDALLFAVLVAGSAGVYFHRALFLEPSRPLFALAAVGLLLARPSERPLRAGLWAASVAATLWAAQTWAPGSFRLWIACSVAGAVLALRAGSRATAYLLPEADNEVGLALRAGIRRQLQAAAALFLTAYLWDGFRSGPPPAVRAALLLLAAALFLRYLLLQSKHLGIPAVPLSKGAGLARSQRWPVLVLVALLTASPYPGRWLEPRGEGPLLLTSTLLFVLAGLVLALALARTGWDKRDIRKVSFTAGVGAAFVLASVVAELQGEAPERFAVFGALSIAFVLVLPCVSATTKLLARAPLLELLAAPPCFALMVAPVAAASGAWSVSALRGFLAAFAFLVALYDVVVTRRAASGGSTYAVASAAAVLLALRVDVGGAWESFALSLVFVLYALDFRRRAVAGR